jgi:hypothetical protein
VGVSPPGAGRSDITATASRETNEPEAAAKGPPVIASRPPSQAPPVAEGDRARAEAWLADGRDLLRRNLTHFLIQTRTDATPSFQVQNIWKADLVEVTADGYVVEIRYEATNDRIPRYYDGETARFLMRFDSDGLKFVEKLALGG